MRPTRRSISRLAAVAAFCIAVSACGGGGDPETPSVLFSDEVSIDGDGPQYGDSLTKWRAAVEGDQAASSLPSFPGYESVEWEDLVAPDFSVDEIYARYEDRLAAIEDGSPEANAIFEEMQAEYDDSSVNLEMDGKQIQLAGFVAPITYDGDTVVEFLLVPYFGACIHVPPPPPNQTIMVTLADDSLTIEETWGAVWVTGTLALDTTTTNLATASYTITGAATGAYDDY